MTVSTKITVCALVMAFCLVACTYQRKVLLKPTGVPEHIYKAPLHNDYITSSVAVFNFREPPYARGVGRAACESLYEELLRNSVFTSVSLESDVSDIRMESLMEIARDKNYDLIITGDLLYYFEGSLHHPSRVDERIRVIQVATNKTLWYAKAVDIGPPAPYTDHIVVEGRGAEAPTTMTLLKRNAEKFCKMLLNEPSQVLCETPRKDEEIKEEDYPPVMGKEPEMTDQFTELLLEHQQGPVKPQ
jgi:hypothetical protein